MEKVEGTKIRERSDSFKDFFSQAKLFYDSMSAVEKKHILEAFHFELGKVEVKEVRQRMVYMMANVDRELAAEIAKGIGVAPPTDEAMIKEVAKDALPKKTGGKSVDRSPALSMENLKGNSIKGMKVAILFDHGFDYNAVKSVQEMLMENKASSHIISQFHGMIKSSTGEEIETDQSHLTTASVLYDALFIPGGEKSVQTMKMQGYVIHFINETYKHCKPIGVTGNAAELLAKSSIGINVSTEENATSNMGVVTSGKGAQLTDFLDKFKNAMLEHRFWDWEKSSVPA